MADDDGAHSEALESARRVYDRQVDELDSLDDVALWIIRTNVIILGFLAAALTTAGPSAAGEFHWIPVFVGAAGVVTLFTSAFVCVGAYMITQYPIELRDSDFRAADQLSTPDWHDRRLNHFREAITELGEQTSQNANLVAYGLLLQLGGTLQLGYASTLLILSNSYELNPVLIAAGTLILTGLFAALILVKPFVGRDS